MPLRAEEAVVMTVPKGVAAGEGTEGQAGVGWGNGFLISVDCISQCKNEGLRAEASEHLGQNYLVVPCKLSYLSNREDCKPRKQTTTHPVSNSS